MKFTVARPSRPRNPVVAPALMRRAGSHHKDASALRLQAKQQLRQDLAQALRSANPRSDLPDTHSP